MKTITIPVLVVLLVIPMTLSASSYTLTDLNSSVSIDPTTSQGVFNWLVNGQNQIEQGWYWYRLGNSGPELSIDTIGAPVVTQYTNQSLTVTYTHNSFTLSLYYLLIGGLDDSDLSETVSITNTSNGTLEFHLFDYTDFDLGGVSGGDTATLDNTQTITQTNGTITAQTSVNSIPMSKAWAISNSSAIYNSLTDANPTVLTSSASPLTGDCEFAFQWDFNIGNGLTQMVSKDKLITGVAVPEPGSIAGLAGGIAFGLSAFARRRRNVNPNALRT